MTRKIRGLCGIQAWWRRLCALSAATLLVGCEALSWGTDNHGQLGDGVIGGSRSQPGAAAAGMAWRTLEAGWLHACGVRADGSLWCWGLNNRGQLGVGYEDVDSAIPLQVGTATDWITVSPGFQHTCGIRAGGQLWCWGRGGNGQLGDGLSEDSPVPVRVGTAADWREVSAGMVRFTCGIRGQGDLYCWGLNSSGQLGVGDLSDRATPTLAGAAGAPWKGIDAGSRHACAIDWQQRGYCWGDNTDDQINVQLGDNVTAPAPLRDGAVSFISMHQISAGLDNTCFINRSPGNPSDRTGRCIGESAFNVSGAIDVLAAAVGCTDTPCSEHPNTPRFRQIDITSDFACGIVNGTNQALCWGAGGEGQLGDGGLSDNPFPEPVLGDGPWWTISTGSNFALGLEIPGI